LSFEAVLVTKKYALAPAPFAESGYGSCPQVAIREVGKFEQRGIECGGLARARFACEEAVADAICNGFHQERRAAVPDPGRPGAIAPHELEFLRIRCKGFDFVDSQFPQHVWVNQSCGRAAGVAEDRRRWWRLADRRVSAG